MPITDYTFTDLLRLADALDGQVYNPAELVGPFIGPGLGGPASGYRARSCLPVASIRRIIRDLDAEETDFAEALDAAQTERADGADLVATEIVEAVEAVLVSAGVPHAEGEARTRLYLCGVRDGLRVQDLRGLEHLLGRDRARDLLVAGVLPAEPMDDGAPSLAYGASLLEQRGAVLTRGRWFGGPHTGRVAAFADGAFEPSQLLEGSMPRRPAAVVAVEALVDAEDPGGEE